jgi:hypothetical protein
MKPPKYLYYCSHCNVCFPFETVLGSKCKIIKYVPLIDPKQPKLTKHKGGGIEMRTFTKEELRIILEKHSEWIKDNSKGERANLSGSDLSRSNLRWSNLSGSDLSGSNLRWSDLSGSNLSGSDLSGSNLSGSNTDKRYIQISCIGSRKDMTTYCFEDDKIWCGCWQGTLDEFEIRVKETHKDNKQYLAEYLGFIKYLRGLKK